MLYYRGYCRNLSGAPEKKGVFTMKSTGIVRRTDELGRIVIPIELRRKFNIEEKDGMEIFVDRDCIILRKYEPSCVFCGSAVDVTRFRDKAVCKDCVENMAQNVV